MKDWTILIAHPDDEILWCWPVLGEAKKIVCASSDEHNPDRAWCKERRLCLEEVGRRTGAEVVCFDANSEFYRMPTRGGELKAHAAKIVGELAGKVFTHNPWGEYGHLDHILCNQIAMASGREVYSTDICHEINWLPMRQWGRGNNERALIARETFDELKRIYDARGCWTWSFEPTLECGLLKLC